MKRWVHSFEEDTGDVKVYRPATYPFPRARGREGIEFLPEGSVVYSAIGRGDAPEPIRGQWRAEESGPVEIAFEGQAREPRRLEIVEAGDDILRLRESPA